MDTKNSKVRLSVDCTEEERMYIKMLAAKNHMTISDYLLSFARREMPKKCVKTHEPNETTKKALKESKEESGEIFESLTDFWDAMGIEPNAKN